MKNNPCHKCESKCCRYIALQIDTPRAKTDFENVRWYLAHKDISIFVEKGKWYLEIKSDCRYLTRGHRCSIYDKRPLICREHSPATCESSGDDFAHEHTFRSVDQLDEFVAGRFRRRKRASKRCDR